MPIYIYRRSSVFKHISCTFLFVFHKLTAYFCRSYLKLWGIFKLIYWFIESIRVTRYDIENGYLWYIRVIEKYWIPIDSISFIFVKLMSFNNSREYVSTKKRIIKQRIAYQQFCFINLCITSFCVNRLKCINLNCFKKSLRFIIKLIQISFWYQLDAWNWDGIYKVINFLL